MPNTPSFSTQLFGGYRKSEIDEHLHHAAFETAELQRELAETRERLEQHLAEIRDRTTLDFLIQRLSDLSLGEQVTAVTVAIRELAPEKRASILGVLRPDAAAVLLANLPHDERLDAVNRLSEPQLPTRGELALNLSTLVERCLAEQQQTRAVGGIAALASILEQAHRTCPELLGAWMDAAPEAARDVRRKMLLPEDLLQWSARSLQVLMKQVKTDDLVTFLATQPSELTALIGDKAVSRRAFEMIKEQVEVRGAVPPTEATAAYRTIMGLARQVRDGKI